MLVDSCTATGASEPASAEYLRQLNIPAENVKAIVASHWHDDHVRGMSRLVRQYPNATFFYPAVFSNKEAQAFLAAYSGEINPQLTRGTGELYRSLMSRERSVAVKNRVEILSGTSPEFRVFAFSPTDAALSQFLAHIFEYIPREDLSLPIGHAPPISPNLSSVVLHVDLGAEALLLGADLERHEAGWDAVIADEWCRGKVRAGVVKIAHHGSITGDHPDIWTQLAMQKPLGLISPFNNGRHTLPKAADVMRILSNTREAFITSGSSRKPKIPTDQLKRLQDMCTAIAPANAGFGAVRARRSTTAVEWQIELFGSAKRLSNSGSKAA